MPNPQFTRPWHGVPREKIHWNPSVLEDACIGCGTCVTGCSRLVYRFDYERKKPVVFDALNCMVGCTTCANTCPAHAIVFPPIESVLALEGLEAVRHAIEDDLLARRDILAAPVSVPHPDRIVALEVAALERLGADVVRVRLKPVVPGECFCEIMPGQYVELWRPDTQYLSRAYSVANLQEGDGSLELHIRRVEGGRFSEWACSALKVGDRLQARGPLGAFTMRSRPETPLLFVAGGTGLAPVLALLRQQAKAQPQRDMALVWGARTPDDLYALNEVLELLAQAPGLRVVLATETSAASIAHPGVRAVTGSAVDALLGDTNVHAGRDIYAAGPAPMLRALGLALDRLGVARERVRFDAFGV